MSPTTSYDCSSNAYDVQLEKLLARDVKSSSSSCCPWALRHAPRTLTGSFRDQSARRGAASPLCRANSASYRVVLTQARKSSRSVMPPTLRARDQSASVTVPSALAEASGPAVRATAPDLGEDRLRPATNCSARPACRPKNRARGAGTG